MSENELLKFQDELQSLINKEVENKRRAAWGGLGVQVYHGELSLQLEKQNAIKALINDVNTKNIKEAEESLSIVKKKLEKLISNRTSITEKLDTVKKRLMENEKELELEVQKNIAEIILVKKHYQEEQKTKENKQKELKAVESKVRIYIADMHSAYLQAQAKLIKDAYDHALKEKISVDKIDEYKKKICARITPQNRSTPSPSVKFVYNDQDTIDAEIKKHFRPWTAQQYIDGFNNDLNNKFSDWELALKNSEIATKNNQIEFDENVNAIEQDKKQEEIHAKLDSQVYITEDTGIKKIKTLWKIANEETWDNAISICVAFIVNKTDCIKSFGDRLKKPFNLSVFQMGNALAGLKNEDEAFECTGIEFKQIEKL